MIGFPVLPFFVVTIITPFAARAPYMAVAAASFRIVILSISFGLIPAMDDCFISTMLLASSPRSGMSVPSKGIPSNTHNGSCVPFNEAVPRIRIRAGAPGAPEVVVTATPAICPANAWSILFAAPTIPSVTSTLAMAAVSLRRSSS